MFNSPVLKSILKDITLQNRLGLCLPLVLVLLIPCILHADIVDSSATGLTVRSRVAITATPARVYNHIISDVGLWWNSAHTWSGNSQNLTIDTRAGGCFCEKLANGGSAEHMRVVYAAPGKMLRLSGALGPFQSLAVTGTMTWTLTKSDQGTVLVVEYTLGGYRPGGMAPVAGAVDYVITEQVSRLKRFIETGKPD